MASRLQQHLFHNEQAHKSRRNSDCLCAESRQLALKADDLAKAPLALNKPMGSNSLDSLRWHTQTLIPSPAHDAVRNCDWSRISDR